MWSGACTAPDVYGIGGSYGQGTSASNFDQRPVNSWSGTNEGWAILPYVEWHIGERKRHHEREEWHDDYLDATRRLEVTAATGTLQPMPVQHDHEDGAAPFPVEITNVPKTRDEAWNFFIWAGGILGLGLAAYALNKAGIKLPFSKSEPQSPKDKYPVP